MLKMELVHSSAIKITGLFILELIRQTENQ